jgi:hypothetical protein
MRQVTDKTLSHNVLSNTPRSLPGFELTALVAIGDCISNYYAITTTTPPRFIVLLTSSYLDKRTCSKGILMLRQHALDIDIVSTLFIYLYIHVCIFLI